MPDTGFHELANAWMAGQATAAEQDALLRLVAGDTRLQEELRTQHRQHLRLAAVVAAPGHALVAARARAVAAAGSTTAVRRTIQGVARRRRRGGKRSWWPAVAVLAAAAALVLIPLWLRFGGQAPASAAMAVVDGAASGADLTRDGRESPLRPGMDLLPDDRIQVSDHGGATVLYPDRTRLEVLASTQVQLWDEDGAKRIRLDRGGLHCTVAPQPAGKAMKLRTDQAEAEVVGTRFVLRAEARLTRLEVEEGTVAFRGSDGASSLVHAHGSAEAGTAASVAVAVAPRRWPKGPSTDPGWFPIGVWMQEPQHAARYHQAGINLYLNLWKEPGEAELATLRREGMVLICEQTPANLRHRDDPTIIAWFLADGIDNARLRPDGGYDPPWTPDEVVERYTAAVRADPDRPVLADFGQGAAWDGWYGRGERTGHPEDYRDYLRGCDIATSTIYPVAHERPEIAGRLWYVARGVERLRGWSDGAKPVWAFIECAGINSGHAPSPAQVRAEVWMAVASGATGIVYYVHQLKPVFNDHALLDDPPLLAEVGELNRRLHELAPVLNEPTATAAASVTADPAEVPIACLAKRHGGALHLLTVSLRDVAATARISVPGLAAGTAVEVVGEDRRLVAEAGGFSDPFQPYQMHLYRLP